MLNRDTSKVLRDSSYVFMIMSRESANLWCNRRFL